MSLGKALLLALAACQPSNASPLSMQSGAQRVETIEARQKAVFRRYVRIWESGALDELPGVIAPDYAGHAASADRGIEGLRARIAEFHHAYRDLRFVIEDQVAEGDRVATRMTARGIANATGKPVTLIGLNVSRFHDGRIAEEWPVWEVAP